MATPRHDARYSYNQFEPNYPSADTPNYQVAPTPGEGPSTAYTSGATPSMQNGPDRPDTTGPGYSSGRTPYDDSATPGVGVGTPAMGAGTPGMGATPGFDAPYSPTAGTGATPGMGATPGFASTPGMAPTPYGSAPTPGSDGYGIPGGEGPYITGNAFFRAWCRFLPTDWLAWLVCMLAMHKLLRMQVCIGLLLHAWDYRSHADAGGLPAQLAPLEQVLARLLVRNAEALAMLVCSLAIHGRVGNGCCAWNSRCIGLMESWLLPAGAAGQGMDYTLWEGVLVQQEGGQLGIVRSPTASGACQVQLVSGAAAGSKTLPSDEPTVPSKPLKVLCLQMGSQLTLVQPHKGDTVRVLQAEGLGRTAVIVGEDGADGIVKMPPNDEVKILQMSHMGVLVE
ncbi:hypothetical protein MMC29_008372 [Sticta canariensis]|nr:hypothetical protein [Sticta canariensis]